MSYTIEKLNNGKYKIRVYSNKDEFGKVKTKQISNINTIAVAKKLALEIEEKLNLKEETKDYTFQELYNLYMNAKAKKLSPNTLKNKKIYYETTLNYWGNVKAKNINTRNVQEWVNNLENTKTQYNKRPKKATIQEYVKSINTILNWAVGQDYLEYNKIKRIEYLEDEEEFEATILSKEQIIEILKDLKQNYYNLYIPTLLALTTSTRRSEALGIKWNDINFEDKTITLNRIVYEDENHNLKTKNKLKTISSKRKLFMTDFLINELKEHKKYSYGEYVCNNIFIGEITPSYLTHKFHDYIKSKFKIKIRFHDLRHNFNQLLYENGIDDITRSKLMGHKNSNITNKVYTHLSEENTQKVVNIINKTLDKNN